MKMIMWVILSTSLLFAVLITILAIFTKNFDKEVIVESDIQNFKIDYPPVKYYEHLKSLHDPNDTLFIESDSILSSY